MNESTTRNLVHCATAPADPQPVMLYDTPVAHPVPPPAVSGTLVIRDLDAK